MAGERRHKVMVVAVTALIALFAVGTVKGDAVSFTPVYIDCGSTVDYLDPDTGITWSADKYFTGNGTNGLIPTASRTGVASTLPLSEVDITLRTWNSGDSCYSIPVASDKGRYLVRLSFAYNNYDNKYLELLSGGGLPSIGVSIEGYFVEAVAGFGQSSDAYYTDYVATVGDGFADICFSPLQSSTSTGAFDVSPPFVNSIQILPVDSQLFLEQGTLPDNVILSTWARLNSGGVAVVPTADAPKGYRTWAADPWSNVTNTDVWQSIGATGDITVRPDYASYAVPQDVLKTARQASGNYTGYLFTDIHPVNQNNSFLVVAYIAEVDPTVTDRMVQMYVNGMDAGPIVLEEGGVSKTSGLYVYTMQTSLADITEDNNQGPQGKIQVVFVTQWSVGSAPIVNGIEIYEIIEPYVVDNLPNSFKMRIDCGNGQNYFDGFNNVWQADNYYSSGRAANALKPGNPLALSTTLRYFNPLLSNVQNCYSIPLTSSGVYLLRAFFDFGSYQFDSTTVKSPYVGFGVEGIVMSSFTADAPGIFRSVLVYIDKEADNDNVAADICVYGNGQDTTFINSVEVLQVDASSYNASQVGISTSTHALYMYTRINSGGDMFGDLLTNDTEQGFRQWASDEGFISGTCNQTDATGEFTVGCSKAVTASVTGVDVAPYYWPSALFKGQLESAGISYSVPVFPNSTALLYFHFVEANWSVSAGARTFTVTVNGQDLPLYNTADGAVYPNIDVVKIAGGANTALAMYAKVATGSLESLEIKFVKTATSTSDPIVSGIEVYGAFARVNKTLIKQAGAMTALKKSLNVKEELGWQGDPCVPYQWEGVTCGTDDAGNIAIAVIELTNMGLDGTLTPDVISLENLKTLNLSSNSLTGPIPNTLPDIDGLIKLDLSYNQFTGNIPAEFTNDPSLRYLKLQHNNLEGQLPADLIPLPTSIQVDYSDNPYLCGGNGLLDCANVPPYGVPLPPLGPPTSTGGGGGGIGLIAGAIAGVVVLLAVAGVVALLIIRRRRARQRLPLSLSGDGGSRLTMEA